jgi:ATP-dependent Clp protease ATP-binding subunit ClpA
LFYQILDEGILKDSKGETIYFDNVIIIMTSNIGFNKNNIGFNNCNNVNIDLKEYFSIPFINRIDNIIKFNYLTYEDIKKIIKIKLNKLKNKYSKKDITLKINNSVIEEIINMSNYKEFGARKIDKIIKTELENLIINEILENRNIINIKKISKEKVIN